VKVLVVHNYYQQRGGEDATFEQECRLLTRFGHTVIPYQRSNREIENTGALSRLLAPLEIIWNARTRRDFEALLQTERPDVVHVHNTFFMISPSIFAACQEAGVPVVQTLQNYRLFCPVAVFFREGKVCEDCLDHSLWEGIRHGCYHNSRRDTTVVAAMIKANRALNTWPGKVDAFIAVTPFGRRKLVQGGLPADRIVVKPNFVEPDPGAGGGARDYALFVGRLSPEKRAATMLRAWNRLDRPVPLKIAGGGPDYEGLRQQAERDRLKDVEFLGQVPRDRTLALIQGARFLVFPSEWYEGFPVTICEAFACGTPVICSRMGAMEEIVEHNRTGFHFSPGDAGALADRVAWAWSHPVEMSRMGSEARREFEMKYTAEKNHPLLMEIYNWAIARKSGRVAADAPACGPGSGFGGSAKP
jgi:glycosyltransferase involved in cell wall biosynthesis